jgi:hypothetical protein
VKLSIRFSTCLFLAALLVSPSAKLPAQPEEAPPNRFRFERANRTYRDLAPELATFEQGDLAVRFSSPRNALTLRDHLLRLEPGAGGSHAAELTLEIEGEGWLVADVTMGAVVRRLEDEVHVPRQKKTLEGRARLARAEGGYRITPEQLPRRVEVAVRSGVGDRLLALCESMARLPGLAVDCSGVERAVSTLVVDLPEAGESYLLPAETLTRDERRVLDEYLERSAK